MVERDPLIKSAVGYARANPLLKVVQGADSMLRFAGEFGLTPVARSRIAAGVYAPPNAVGRAAFDASSAERLAACGDPVILVRPDTSTSDVAGFAAAAGIVTAVGSRTAHAALVARQMGKPCIVGCGDLTVDMASRQARIGASAIKEGEWISVDGEGGSVHLGRLEVIVERPDAELAEVERWRAGANPREAVS
jgi:pyruvate,orthophosphate dikinase